MMRKIIYNYRKAFFSFILILSLAFTGCEEEFLDADPQSFFTPSNALDTPEGLNSLLSQAMRNLRAEFYGDGAPMITENIFSEVSVEGTTDKSGPAQDLKA